jgi:hypothetical protein
MLMKAISARTRSQAWLDACKYLDQVGGLAFNLIVEVVEPKTTTKEVSAVQRYLNDFLLAHKCQPVTTVADTIFPTTEYKAGGIEGVYAYPQTIYANIKSERANNKGTYALRIVQRRNPDGGYVYPLKILIEKLRHQLNLSSPAKKAVYELDLHLEPMELALYEAAVDHDNIMGGQCLSHLSLKLGPNRELYMTALYRSQYFIQKALGNYLGLAHLQACIAREVGIEVGPLVCHATMAKLEDGDGKSGQIRWGITEKRALIARCSAAVEPTA